MPSEPLYMMYMCGLGMALVGVQCYVCNMSE